MKLYTGCHPFRKPLMTSKVTKTSFWMAHYQARTPKRHYIYANTTAIGKLNKGRLTFRKRKPTRVETVRKYKNKDGKACYAGTNKLQATESLWLQKDLR